MNMIKLAMPFVPGAGATSRSTERTRTTATPRQTTKPVVPPKNPSQLDLSIKNLLDIDKFPHWKLEGFPMHNIAPPYSTISQFIQEYPPTPAGVPYRVINPDPNSGGILANVNAYIDLLNRSGLYSELLSPMSSGVGSRLSRSIASDTPIYLVDGRDAANWLWNRRGGLKITDAGWNWINKARLSVTSQLNKIPQTIYYAWSNDDKDSAYSLHFNKDKNNNLFINVFNPKHFDLPYMYSPYNGLSTYANGTILKPWRRFMHFLETQDHELSHSFNNVVPTTLKSSDRQWVEDGLNSGYKENMFFRRTNNPKLPYYDDDTTRKRVQKFLDTFRGTYLERPSEYIGAMSRIKRYGAELGFATTSTDPTKARAAMAQTIRYFASHPKPEELTSEQQRIRSWIQTVAINHRNKYAPSLHYNDYIKDVLSPFYRDVLDFMTDSTIQGLVRNNTTSNNINTLQNLRYSYA